MTEKRRRLAILTSGGDCAGMNAAVCAIVKLAIFNKCEAYVVREGYSGLVKGNGDYDMNQDGGQKCERMVNNVPLSYGCGDMFRLGDVQASESEYSERYIVKIGWDDVRGWEGMGGTLIGTARCKEFRERDGRLRAVYNLIHNGIDSLVVIGGDGSLTGADILRQEWPNLVDSLHSEGRISDEQAREFRHLHIAGLVGSIDNDLTSTELTIGASTALQRISESLDSIESTASSHSRAFVVEVMGRHCGWLALMAGIASGADYIFIPERPPPEDWRSDMRELLLKSRAMGKRKTIVIVAEGATDRDLQPIKADMIAEVLSNDLHLDTRVTTLGHTQRGGRPDANDRILATLQGIEALKAILEDNDTKPSYIIGNIGGRVCRMPLRESIAENQKLAEAISERRFEDAMALRGADFREGIKSFLYNSTVDASVNPRTPSELLNIGIMHMGAPSGGINAAARTAVRFCLNRGHRPLLIQNGFRGLIKGAIHEAPWLRVDTWATSGGSELGTNRILPEENYEAVAEQLEKHNIDALLIIGGFEAFLAIKQLSEKRSEHAAFRIPMIALPATLSNNLPLNEYTVGTYTSLNTLVSTCDMITQSASASRNRVFVVEVQGGQCGFVAVVGSLAVAATVVYTPEDGVALDRLHKDIGFMRRRFQADPEDANDGRLVICNERASSVYTAQTLAHIYGEEGHAIFDSRYERLSHILQGGTPSPLDRVYASRLAVRCCEFLEEHAGASAAWDPPSAMITLRLGEINILPISKIVEHADFENRTGKDIWWAPLKDYVEIISGQPIM
ncbi:6-phosphofructokinase, alpha subunit [Malassezia pachydermatis]|uniref:6-phosphofructokinase n=1 Tax=Malassezia pachydermatis TaxID=77020 RepID=A0A0M8MQ19_9BASI|nr:6-phosphofructokinase [Malassezia pachydermatis]KOS16048.1 6-phosphofructokinase [Malassezia pachydermatis]